VSRVGCMPMLDRPLPRHEARDAAFGPRLQAVSNARINRRARTAATDKFSIKGLLIARPVE